MPLQQREEQPDAGEAQPINREKLPGFRFDVGPMRSAAAEPEREKIFQRINRKQDEEKNAVVHPDDKFVLQAVAPEEAVVLIPKDHEQREGRDERGEVAHHVEEFIERMRHLEGDDEQRHGKRENGIAESLDAGDFAAPPVEVWLGMRSQEMLAKRAAMAGHEGREGAVTHSWLATWTVFRNLIFRMTLFRRNFLTALAGACTLPAGAGEIRLPPVTGELSGDFKLFDNETAPKLHWALQLRAAGDAVGSRVLETKIDGAGTRLGAEASLTTTEHGSWKITEGGLDLATWFPLIAEKAGDAMKGLAAIGTVELKGSGLMRAGKPSGVVQATVREGRLGDADAGWALEGVALTAEFLVEAEGLKIKSTTPFELTVATITTPRFGARNLFVTGVLNEDRTIAVSAAHIEIAGGDVKIDPTMLTLAPFGLEATLHIVNVGLQDVAALVPKSFSSSQGRIDGTVRMGWSVAGGFRVGAGNLALGQSEPAIVQLAPAPGFLTQTMPKRFEPLPFARWLSIDNPVYTDMAEIELGRAPLRVESLTVRLTPEGDERGRTATVRMKARPIKPEASVKTVNIDVNVDGPLDSILKLGMNQDLSIEVH